MTGVEQISNQVACLVETRDTLLPKLISGELRIPEAEKLVSDLG
jgi:type I restriction enzyme S subunit